MGECLIGVAVGVSNGSGGGEGGDDTGRESLNAIFIHKKIEKSVGAAGWYPNTKLPYI